MRTANQFLVSRIVRAAVATLSVVLSGLSTSSCYDQPSANGPLAPNSSRQVHDAAVGIPASTRPDEALFAELSKDVPSAAGFYFDPSGALVVNVAKAKEEATAARIATATLVSTRRLAGWRERAFSPAIRVQQVRFTYKQLADWRDIAFDEVLARIPGVSSLDLDEARNRVAIGVLPSASTETRQSAVAVLARRGVDTTAIVFDRVGKHINDAPPANLDGSAFDWLAGGLRIDVQHPDATWHTCTLGFPATRSGTQGFVTASHCTSGTYGPDNNLVAQILPRQVGTESVDPYGYTC